MGIEVLLFDIGVFRRGCTDSGKKQPVKAGDTGDKSPFC